MTALHEIENATTSRFALKPCGDLKRRTREILNSEVSFRFKPEPDAEVDVSDVAARLESVMKKCAESGRADAATNVLPVTRYLLTAEEERALFRDMNFLKYRATVLRSRLDPQQPSCHGVERIESLLDLAGRIRDQLAECNSRLVIANARDLSNSEQQFEELVSDGFTVLMRAVDLFDYSRGYRFSTYLTHSVRRHFYRLIQNIARRRKRQPVTENEVLSNVPDRELPPESGIDFARLCNRVLRKGRRSLDEREQTIVALRFGLNGEKSQTLRQIADLLGISKERVRQLQMRALEKLRSTADSLNVTIP